MKDLCNTKIKILKKSEELFAKNGYSATPISKIADECNISKSLVSYHFKKKKRILKKIIDYHFSEIRKKRDKIIDEVVNKYMKNGNISKDIISKEMIDMMIEKENFWKLLIYEIVRNDDIWNYFKTFLKKWHEDMFEKLEEKGLIIKDKKMFIFNRIFNIIGPIMLYSLRKKEWNEYFDLNENKAKKQLIKNFNKIIKSNLKEE